MADRVAFYPGCSLKGTAKDYLMSTQGVCSLLGITLSELPDWTCCGASSAHSLDGWLAVKLPAWNLAAAAALKLPLVTPCAACYSRLKGAAGAIAGDPVLRGRIKEITGQDCGEVKVYHLLEYIMQNGYSEKIASLSGHKFKGIKIASYYGCLLSRPEEVTRMPEPEAPRIMDDLVRILGGSPVSWSMNTDCCGASLSLSSGAIVTGLVERILDNAVRSGADAVATACPLCQVNLEMRRGPKFKIPVYYFTELLGLDMGDPASIKALDYHLVDPFTLLKNRAVI